MAKSGRSLKTVLVVFAALAFLAGSSVGQDQPLFRKFGGRVPIFSLASNYPNPALAVPENDGVSIDPANCSNGIDDDADGNTDYADSDCQGDLGPQDLYLKLPFDVIQPIGTFAPARFTGTNRNGDPLGEILINTSGPGGRKVSYLRTGEPNRYQNVKVRVVVLPGKTGDQGGPVAIRIQPADAPSKAGMSYFVKTVPGEDIAIHKEKGDGTSVELASAAQWASGDQIKILDYDEIAPTDSANYLVEFTAVGGNLTATVSEINYLAPILNNFEVVNNHTVTLTATDGDLAEGYVGLRSDNEVGGELVDDLASAYEDPSVIDYVIIDPEEKRLPEAPKIAFFHCYTTGLDTLNYTTTPITSTDDRPHRRSGAVVADTTLASYLRSLGFQVDEYHIGSFSAQIFTPDFINENYDLFWLPSSGGSADTRAFARSINIPFVFSEHVVGQANFGGMWEGTGNLNGNENQLGCPQTRFIATLNGAQETPNPIATDATGSGFFEYDPLTHELKFEIQYSGLSSPENAAHFHQAPPGDGGPPIHPLPPGNPKSGTVTLTDDEQTALFAGQIYVNIHTDTNGGGEIRGQLLVRTVSMEKLRVIPSEKGGNPDHPIVRGLADEDGNILVHDAAEIPINVPYPLPGSDPVGLTGKGFKPVLQILEERGWGPGTSETQFAGYPPAPGAVALAAMVNPCSGEPFFNLDDNGALTTFDGKGHIHLMAAEAGGDRVVTDPENCPEPCVFPARQVFYWISDPIFPYSTTKTLSLIRRSALWALGYLESPNRSDVPFKRGDSNADGNIDLSDAVHTLNWLFLGGPEPTCKDTADANDDEIADISDAVYSLTFQFLGGEEIGFPFALTFQGCGLDLTPPALKPGETEEPDSILSCNSYQACRS